MGRSKNIFILSINDALLLCYLQCAYGKYKIHSCSRVSLEGKGKFPWLEDRSYAEEISAFIVQNRVDTDTIILSIPGRDAVTTCFRLPVVTRDDAEGMLRYEIEKHVPFLMDSVNYGYRVRNAPGSAGLDVALVAIEKSTLEKYVALLNEAGVKPSAVCVEALGHIAYWHNHEQAQDKAFLLLKVKSREVDLCLVDRGLMKYFRCIPRRDGEPFIPLVCREMRSIEKHVSQYAIAEPSFVVVSGIDEEARQGAVDLQSRLGLKVISGRSSSTGKAPQQEGVPQEEVSGAIGLAQAFMHKGELINLLPAGYGVAVKRRSPITSLRVLLVLAFIALGFLFSRAYSDRKQLETINQELQALQGQVLQVEDLSSRVNAYRTKLSTFEGLRLKERAKLELLQELTVMIPPTAWLSVLMYEGGKLDISGYAESASGLIPILEESDYFTNAKFIAPIVQGPYGEEFKIRVNVEK